MSSQGKEIDIIKRIKQLYISYWKVFLIFIPIAFLFFSNQPIYTADAQISTRYNDFNFTYLISNFFAIEATYNSEWWFVKSYIIAIFSYPFIKRIIEKRAASASIFLIIVFSVINGRVLPYIGNIEWLGTLNTDRLYSDLIRQVAPFISSFWMGIAFAKNGLLNYLNRMMRKNGVCGITIDLVCVLTVSFMRQVSLGPDFGFLYVPVLILSFIDIFERLPWIKVVLLKIGNQSTNMWLIHSFYCYYFYYISKVIVSLKWAVPALVFLIVITYVTGIVIDFIWETIETGWKKSGLWLILNNMDG